MLLTTNKFIDMKYKKKPVVIEAVQWTGDNCAEVVSFMNFNYPAVNRGVYEGRPIAIVTKEGVMMADVGDYIIKGVKGEFYPCKPDIFAETYEIIND